MHKYMWTDGKLSAFKDGHFVKSNFILLYRFTAALCLLK